MVTFIASLLRNMKVEDIRGNTLWVGLEAVWNGRNAPFVATEPHVWSPGALNCYRADIFIPKCTHLLQIV